jgi:hypothetical protein
MVNRRTAALIFMGIRYRRISHVVRVDTVSEQIQMRKLSLFCLLAVATLSSRLPLAAQAEPGLPAQHSATAMGQAGAAAGKSFGVDFYVTALTPDGEIQEAAALLKSKGQDALVKSLEKAKEVGRIAPTGFVGASFQIARIRESKDGSRQIILVANRPLNFYELRAGTRTTDYPFTIVVLKLDKDGKGTGTLAPLVKLKFNKKNELEVEHYGQKPFRLVNVRKQK